MSEVYTEELTRELVSGYTEVAEQNYDDRTAFVRSFSAEHGISTRSIIAKLSREGVYKARENTDKLGRTRHSKRDLVVQIADSIGVPTESLPGLDKANRETLRTLADVITRMKRQASTDA